jgi:hypothetical protein
MSNTDLQEIDLTNNLEEHSNPQDVSHLDKRMIFVGACLLFIAILAVYTLGMLAIIAGCNLALGECTFFRGDGALEKAEFVDKTIYNETEYYTFSRTYNHKKNCTIDEKYDTYDEAFLSYNRSYNKNILVKVIDGNNNECIIQSNSDLVAGYILLILGSFLTISCTIFIVLVACITIIKTRCYLIHVPYTS